MDIEERKSRADRIFAGFKTLLSPSELTHTELSQILAAFPELLSEEAQLIGSGIAQTQHNQSAKESVERVVSLLQRCRDCGVDKTLVDERLRQGRERKEERMAHLKKMALAKRRSFIPEGIPKKTSYPSLGECSRALHKSFPQSFVTQQTKSVANPGDTDLIEAKLPRFYFRGEPGNYSSTLPSRDRLLKRTDLSLRAIEDILRCAIRIQAELVKTWKISAMLAEGFLQHYGMPTSYLDLTSELDVAISFASDLEVGKVGRIGVAPLNALGEKGQLMDLSQHPFAERPARQRAFAWTSEWDRDLNAPATKKALGLEWFPFEFTEQDKSEFGPDPMLLDAHSDKAAGTIELAMNGMGKIEDSAAKWIAERLQPAPFVMIRVPGNPQEKRFSFLWVSAEEAGIPYVERNDRKSNYERWSNAFAAVPVEPLPEELRSTAADIPMGATVRVTTTQFFDFIQPS